MENFQAEGRTQYRLFEYDFIRVVAMVFVIAVHALVVIDFADKFSLFYSPSCRGYALCVNSVCYFFCDRGPVAFVSFEQPSAETRKKDCCIRMPTT